MGSNGQNVGLINLGLDIDNKSFNRKLNGIGKSAEKSAASAFSGLGKKLGIALGTAAIIGFTKSCLELGSDLAEVQNVVDVTFGDMADKVNKFAKDAMTNFGLSETVAKKYMGTLGSMSKAMGFSSDKVYEMSEAVTGLAGDVASFYNLSSDEAFTKLKSIWTGESESLKDIGVLLTQTNLDQYALANGFGKTTAKMTEQEKVMLRYQYTMSALADAQGDFARTSDGWANQVRVLTLRFDSLKATLGQGFINLFTPIVKQINRLLSWLDAAAQKFVQFTALLTGKSQSYSLGSTISDMTDSTKGLTSATGDLGKTAKEAAEEAMEGLAGFDKLNNLSSSSSGSNSYSNGSGSGSSGGSSGNISSSGGSILSDVTVNPEIEKALNKIKEICQPTLDALKKLKDDGLKKLEDFTWGALKDFYNDFLVPISTWIMGEGLPQLIEILNDFLEDVDWDTIKTSLDDFWLALEPFAEELGQGIIDFYNDFFDLGADFINKTVPGGLDALTKVLNSMDPKTIRAIGRALGALSLAIIGLKLAGAVGSLLSGLLSPIKKLHAAKDKIKDVSNLFKNLFNSFKNGKKDGKGIKDLFKDLKDTIKEFGDKTDDTYNKVKEQDWESLGKNQMESYLKGLEDGWKDIDAFMTDIPNKMNDYFKNTGTDAYNNGNNFTQNLKDGASTTWDDVKTWFSNLPGKILDFYKDLGTNAYNLGEKFIKKLKSGAVTKWADGVGEWFSKIPGKIGGFFSDFGEKATSLGEKFVKSLKSGASTKWTDSVGEWFTNLPGKITKKFDNLGTKMESVGESIQSGIKDGWNNGWSSFSSWLGNLGTKIKNGIGSLVDKGKQLVNELTSGFKSTTNSSNGNPKTTTTTKTSSNSSNSSNSKINSHLKQYASGGQPTTGEMFIARENGPELVGRIGNKTTVANNDQIVSSITSGVYNAMRSAMSGIQLKVNTPQITNVGRTQGTNTSDSSNVENKLQQKEMLVLLREFKTLLKDIKDKDLDVQIGDTQIGEASRRYAKAYKKSTGKEAF